MAHARLGGFSHVVVDREPAAGGAEHGLGRPAATLGRALRLLAAVVCTAGSALALWFSVRTMAGLFLAAWGLYLVIVACWVRNGWAPRGLVLAGAALGGCAVVASVGMGLLWAAPAVGLMLHITWRSLRRLRAGG